MSTSPSSRLPTLPVLLAAGFAMGAVALAWALGLRAAEQHAAAPSQAQPVRASALKLPSMPEPPRIDGVAGAQQSGGSANAQDNANPQDRLRQAGGPPQASILRMWETTAKQPWRSTGPALTAKSWVITGMVQRGAQSQVIVLVDGQTEPSFFKVGDTLPGGARLVWIKPDTMGVAMPGGKRLEVAVFQQ